MTGSKVVERPTKKYYSVLRGKSRSPSCPVRRRPAGVVTGPGPGPGVPAVPTRTGRRRACRHHVRPARQHRARTSRRPGRRRPGPTPPPGHLRAGPTRVALTGPTLQRPEPDARVREYGALAGALAAHLIRTSPTPADEAMVAGIAWGRQIARDRAPGPHSPTNRTAHARHEVLGILDDLRVRPRRVPRGRRGRCGYDGAPCWTWPAATPRWSATCTGDSSPARSPSWGATTPKSTCCRSPTRTPADWSCPTPASRGRPDRHGHGGPGPPDTTRPVSDPCPLTRNRLKPMLTSGAAIPVGGAALVAS